MSRGKPKTGIMGRKHPSVRIPPVSGTVFRRIRTGGFAWSDRCNDLPRLLQHADRRAVDEDLARGNGHVLCVHRSPQGKAGDPKREDQGGGKEGFHGMPPRVLYCFDAIAATGDSARSPLRSRQTDDGSTRLLARFHGIGEDDFVGVGGDFGISLEERTQRIRFPAFKRRREIDNRLFSGRHHEEGLGIP